MRRREFLKLSTAGAAALALPDANLLALNLNLPVGHAAGAPATVAAAGQPRLAVAYCAQHAVMSATLLGALLVAADTLRSGDARPARHGARVTLLGVVPSGSSVTAARVLVDFQPFHAWSYSAGAAAKPIALNAPIDAAAGLNL